MSSTPGTSSARRSRTGATSKRGSGPPFGRPRWVAHVTEAPRSRSHCSVGTALRIRKSSVTTRLPSAPPIGTLKSTRTQDALSGDLRQVLEDRDAPDHLPTSATSSTSRCE